MWDQQTELFARRVDEVANFSNWMKKELCRSYKCFCAIETKKTQQMNTFYVIFIQKLLQIHYKCLYII